MSLGIALLRKAKDSAIFGIEIDFDKCAEVIFFFFLFMNG